MTQENSTTTEARVSNDDLQWIATAGGVVIGGPMKKSVCNELIASRATIASQALEIARLKAKLEETYAESNEMLNDADVRERLKAQTIATLTRELEQARKYIRKLDSYVEHRESCRSNGYATKEWSVSSGGRCNCGLAKVLETEPVLDAALAPDATKERGR